MARRLNQPPPTIDRALLDAAQQYLRDQHNHRMPAPRLVQDWGAFYARCAELIRRFVVACHVPAGDREDVAQDVWIELVAKLADFQFDEHRGQFHHWLYTLVHSESVDRTRRAAVRATRHLSDGAVLVDHAPAAHPDAATARRLEREAIDRLFEELRRIGPSCDYQVFSLRWRGERTVDQIAQELHLTPQQVWTHHARAKRRARRVLRSFGWLAGSL